MSLDEYLKKRDFTKTPEPKGSLRKGSGQLRFVVQRHQASRLHYDLRLEMQGSLKSWAVPKGPSMNPEDKRLAIHTEDHPIEYLNFEGTIPKGNYGAGEMQIWDQGTYAGEAENAEELLKNYKKGDLKLEFSGSRLKGKFALVRTGSSEKKDQWLLIKKKDEFATELDYDAENFTPKSAYKTPAEKEKQKPQPEAAIEPMLASPAKEIFNDPAWIYELKWDGYRVIANIKNGEVKLFSRNGVSFNEKFNRLVRDLEQLENDVILDGEVVVVDKKGIPDFQKLQNYDEKTLGELRFYVFDMLWLNGMEMMNLPLIQRKSLIEEVIENTYHTFYCEHLEGMGNTFFQKAIDAGMEGVIAKKANSTYTPGYRSESWLKIKAVKSLEAIICGYTTSEDSAFKSLILGIYKDDKLDYIGNCGSGFSEGRKKDLLKKFKPLETRNSPFKKKINLKGRKPIWLKPELVCEVSYSEMTKNGSLRHPVFKGLREDKNLVEANMDQVATKQVTPDSEKDKSEKAGHLNVGGIQVPLSNLDKVYWPESGITKYDLIDYYLNISEYILPYLKDRPQNLHRHPDGITSEGFYQKDATDLPQWIETVKIDSRSASKQIDYMLCQKEASLLYMANLGCIELNPWNSCIGNLDNPDYTVIDLDPSEKNSFEEVIEVAQAAREILELAKITACCKTSGSKGLHIYIPLQAQYSYEEARNFTKLICYFIQEKLPSLTSMERSLKKRGNKIYLDYLQNRKGQSLASVYCVRPKPGAPVSAAIEWDELKKGLEITDFNIKNMPGRLEKKGDIFGEVLSKGLDMEKALERLNSL
ncbi:DNA ligase D [Gramella sp. GC03-9]|uniref:DNA ligase (ATP) n=1 Tax=Christiangramia oceanisediminis TaxID=2920386 RepID=A0A9X2KUW0_9FLAO|nr:DNA ligase D [Gramella oceanisediminis]MCP9198537.1 DNA ligase D [Gramella oceanisediminis]